MTNAKTPALPGLPGSGPQVSQRNLRRLMTKLPQALHPGAPDHVKEFAADLSQIQRASERLRDDISVTGQALPRRRKLDEIPLDTEVDRAREMATAHREIMISDLCAVIRFIHRHPHIEDAYASTLGRLLTGLTRVDDGRRFYVFEPNEEKTKLPVGDVAAVKRAGMAAAVDAFMAAGMSRLESCEKVAKRMVGCEPTDFGFEAGDEISAAKVERAREEISIGRLKSYKQPIHFAGEDTTPNNLYQKLKGTAQSRGKLGREMALEYAEMLLRGAIERR